MVSRFIRYVVAFAVAAVVIGALAPAGHAQYFGRNKIQYKDHTWRILHTPHFDIHFYEGSEVFAIRAGMVLEDGYEMLSYKLKEVLPWRVPVILYASHNDFLQTNVTTSLLPEGVEAFAEPSRRRIVLPFTVSFKEFQHTAIHELAHVFTFQIIYNQMLDNVFTRNYLFPLPLWVGEGLAEYLSIGWDADSDMFIRDAVINNYLYPFNEIGGFYVYKEGQSVFNYIADTYGHQKVLEILDVLATTRNASAALERTIGLNEDKLYDEWSKALRKHYWPLYPDKASASDLGRRLTNHVKDHGYYNTKPILSPDGEKIAFFSDRSGFIEIYVMSALDGKIIRKLVTGSRSNRFQSLHVLNTSLAWSPDGKDVAFVALSKGHDALFVMDVDSGHELMRVDVGADGLSAPAWSPTRDEIVASATYAGETDLVKINLKDGTYERLTHDGADQLTPRFFPDGNRIVYVHYPEVTRPVPGAAKGGPSPDQLSEMNFLDPKDVKHGASYDIWTYDLATGEQHPLFATPGDDTEPEVLSDGKTVIFASDVSGVNNLHCGNVDTGKTYRFTDVLGGLFTPSVNEAKGRIAFSAFVKGGWDVYVSDDLRGLLSHHYPDRSPKEVLAHQSNTAVEDLEHAQSAPDEGAEADAGLPARELADAAARIASEHAAATAAGTVIEITSRGGKAANEPGKPSEGGATASDSTRVRVRPGAGGIDIDTYEPAIRPPSKPAAKAGEKRKRVEGITDEVPGEEVPFKGGKITGYKTKLAPDFIGQGAGLFYSTGFGFALANSIALSDILGNHRLMFAFNLMGQLQDSDFLLTYYYLKHRIDYGVGAFHFKNYLNSRVTSLGESFSDYQFFSERNYGIFGLMSVPFNPFYRMDLELQAYYSQREFYQTTDPYVSGFYALPTNKNTRRLIEPSIAFVHDSAFFGPFGPVEGSRWRAELSRGVSFTGEDVSRTTGYLDFRWYKMMWWRNAIAFRVLGGGSVGKDPRSFWLGGPLRMRGYQWDDDRLRGERFAMTSLEYRYPLLDALIFGWPGRWGFSNVGGTLFFDAGTAWDKGHDPVLFVKGVNGLRFQDLKGDFGFGTYFDVGMFLINFQFAWQTDLRQVGDYQFQFFIGPTF